MEISQVIWSRKYVVEDYARSDTVDSFVYIKASKTLIITYHEHGTYAYKNVPEEVMDLERKESSFMVFYQKHILGKYKSVELQGKRYGNL